MCKVGIEQSEYVIYVVKNNDNLSKIASQYEGVSYRDIYQTNKTKIQTEIERMRISRSNIIQSRTEDQGKDIASKIKILDEVKSLVGQQIQSGVSPEEFTNLDEHSYLKISASVFDPNSSNAQIFSITFKRSQVAGDGVIDYQYSESTNVSNQYSETGSNEISIAPSSASQDDTFSVHDKPAKSEQIIIKSETSIGSSQKMLLKIEYVDGTYLYRDEDGNMFWSERKNGKSVSFNEFVYFDGTAFIGEYVDNRKAIRHLITKAKVTKAAFFEDKNNDGVLDQIALTNEQVLDPDSYPIDIYTVYEGMELLIPLPVQEKESWDNLQQLQHVPDFTDNLDADDSNLMFIPVDGMELPIVVNSHNGRFGTEFTVDEIFKLNHMQIQRYQELNNHGLMSGLYTLYKGTPIQFPYPEYLWSDPQSLGQYTSLLSNDDFSKVAKGAVTLYYPLTVDGNEIEFPARRRCLYIWKKNNGQWDNEGLMMTDDNGALREISYALQNNTKLSYRYVYYGSAGGMVTSNTPIKGSLKLPNTTHKMLNSNFIFSSLNSFESKDQKVSTYYQIERDSDYRIMWAPADVIRGGKRDVIDWNINPDEIPSSWYHEIKGVDIIEGEKHNALVLPLNIHEYISGLLQRTLLVHLELSDKLNLVAPHLENVQHLNNGASLVEIIESCAVKDLSTSDSAVMDKYKTECLKFSAAIQENYLKKYMKDGPAERALNDSILHLMNWMKDGYGKKLYQDFCKDSNDDTSYKFHFNQNRRGADTSKESIGIENVLFDSFDPIALAVQDAYMTVASSSVLDSVEPFIQNEMDLLFSRVQREYRDDPDNKPEDFDALVDIFELHDVSHPRTKEEIKKEISEIVSIAFNEAFVEPKETDDSLLLSTWDWMKSIKFDSWWNFQAGPTSYFGKILRAFGPHMHDMFGGTKKQAYIRILQKLQTEIMEGKAGVIAKEADLNKFRNIQYSKELRRVRRQAGRDGDKVGKKIIKQKDIIKRAEQNYRDELGHRLDDIETTSRFGKVSSGVCSTFGLLVSIEGYYRFFSKLNSGEDLTKDDIIDFLSTNVNGALAVSGFGFGQKLLGAMDDKVGTLLGKGLRKAGLEKPIGKLLGKFGTETVSHSLGTAVFIFSIYGDVKSSAQAFHRGKELQGVLYGISAATAVASGILFLGGAAVTAALGIGMSVPGLNLVLAIVGIAAVVTVFLLEYFKNSIYKYLDCIMDKMIASGFVEGEDIIEVKNRIFNYHYSDILLPEFEDPAFYKVDIISKQKGYEEYATLDKMWNKTIEETDDLTYADLNIDKATRRLLIKGLSDSAIENLLVDSARKVNNMSALKIIGRSTPGAGVIFGIVDIFWSHHESEKKARKELKKTIIRIKKELKKENKSFFSRIKSMSDGANKEALKLKMICQQLKLPTD